MLFIFKQWLSLPDKWLTFAGSGSDLPESWLSIAGMVAQL